MIEQIQENWICWAILALALFSYQQLWLQFLYLRRSSCSDSRHEYGAEIEYECSAILIAVMPLLGLLGTIVGLLECFKGIAADGASSELMSGGIAEALLTTQLALVCAVPAWLLLAQVRSLASRNLLLSTRGGDNNA